MERITKFDVPRIGECKIINADALNAFSEIDSESINCCVTSPPYFGLRDYGVNGQIGNEKSPQEYVEKLVSIFAEVHRVLRDDGTLWLNLGDSYTQSGKGYEYDPKRKEIPKMRPSRGNHDNHWGLGPKQLVGIPWRVAFALQDFGWRLRQEIIWCLSGSTEVYVKATKGISIMNLKDLYRLEPSTVQLWNGERWTQLLGMSRSDSRGDELEFVLRSGQRISCTPTHKFPTQRGVLAASEIRIGDSFLHCRLPDNDSENDCVIDEDAAWFAGVYLADGSRSCGKIQLSGNVNNTERWERMQKIAKKYGGTVALHEYGNCQTIQVFGKVMSAIIDMCIVGENAKTKGICSTAWRYSNKFLDSLLAGYLNGDGYWDEKNRRWRLGFTRNYRLERDFRTLAARLGYRLKLVPSVSTNTKTGKQHPSFRGEIHMEESTHNNTKNMMDVVDIRHVRCRYMYDIGVKDVPHLFALSSGVLSHNSKPNPMPEAVKDRCTKAHEQIFLFSKSTKYYYGFDEMQEPATYAGQLRGRSKNRYHDQAGLQAKVYDTRNMRSVWTIRPDASANKLHKATFPVELPRRCIVAGCPPGGVVLDPFFGGGTTGLAAIQHDRRFIGIEINPDYVAGATERIETCVRELKQRLF